MVPVLATLDMQLLLMYIVFLLNILLILDSAGQCLSMSLRNDLPILVETFLLVRRVEPDDVTFMAVGLLVVLLHECKLFGEST